MKKIILFLGTIIFMTLKMSTLAAINCQGRSDCPAGYECVYWDDSGIPRPDSSSDLNNVVCGRIYQEDIKVCETNSDCLSSEYCFQPPMPTCPKGQNCLDVMPIKYCVPKPTITPTPPPSSLCFPCPNSDLKSQGDANCDGKIDVYDYSLWLKEFTDGNKGAITKNNWGADFTGITGVCDSKVDIYDYSLWKRYFR